CDSQGEQFDQRPYRTFTNTVETLAHLIRSTYRDVQENITGNHPRIYRQVRAGAEIATIALAKVLPYPNGSFHILNDISIIRQVLIYPPLIFNPPMNKRSGVFERVSHNPLEFVNLKKDDWLCYPARVGPLLIMVYFSLNFFELGFSLSNLFELADDIDLQRRPDAVYLFGVPEDQFPKLGKSQTIFYDDDTPDGVLVAAVPDNPNFGYFGYLKKMILTLHNIKMMKMHRLPYHGAMVNLSLHNKRDYAVLIIGDTGAGKSETLEALRTIASEEVDDITIIADDMGSLELVNDGEKINGYGTETSAFVRLDDLQPGFAFGQIDRTIIMSPAQVSARVVIPVTTFETIVKGYSPDLILYANNYDAIDAEHPIIDRFTNAQDALDVFRAGSVMSKGTTTTTGLVNTYFANVFGPDQYKDLHEPLAEEYFKAFFDLNIFVGQIRTRLGMNGYERSGPEEAARALLETLMNL
ncbi:MAG: phosphoenolpyruvate carboxykinase, partial [Anaerolineaceae bacterium]|nr:phosphoenolpyruvate carboxykinase [Anaerolineaceae bacterium]